MRPTLDTANSALEEILANLLNSEAPITTRQVRTKYHNWIRDNTKIEMIQRDLARDVAKISNLDTDWNYLQNQEEPLHLPPKEGQDLILQISLHKIGRCQ